MSTVNTHLMDDQENLTSVAFNPRAGIPVWLQPYQSNAMEGSTVRPLGYNIVTFALTHLKNDVTQPIVGYTLISVRNPVTGFHICRKGQWEHRSLAEERIPCLTAIM